MMEGAIDSQFTVFFKHGHELTIDIRLDRFVWKNGSAIHIDLVANGNVITKHGYILQSSPFADGAVPSHNRRLDPGVILDRATCEKDATLQTDAITNDNVGPNRDIGSNTAVLANLGGGIAQNVATVDIWLGRLAEFLRALFGQGGEVEAGSAQEVFGLSDIHPEPL